MPDNEQPTSPIEANRPATVMSQSGGVDIDAQRDVTIGGDVIGRDKIVQIINNFLQGDVAQRDLRNRRNMLERVKNDWVKGVLEKSLYHEVMLDLGLEERPDAVQHPWDMTLKMPDRESLPLPPGTKIMQAFDEANHALLILGEPGSGKTTMLLELARDTIARAEQDSTQPIPVVFNLSSRTDPGQSIEDWLIQELHDKYDIPKKIAEPWIDNDDLLLLLDGLDEVKAGWRETCAKSINEFKNKHGQTQLVVCTRITDYKALASTLILRGAIFIQPLTPQQVEEYFARAGRELAVVHDALQYDATLQELAQSPLMLGIMSLAYRGLSKSSMGVDQLGSMKERRKHLFDTYTDKMFDRVARTKDSPHSKADTIHWLAWLAERMSEHGESVFLLDRMKRSWLQTQRQQITLSIGDGLMIGLGIGLVMGLSDMFAGKPSSELLGMVTGGGLVGFGGILIGGLYREPVGEVIGGMIGGFIGGLVGNRFLANIMGLIGINVFTLISCFTPVLLVALVIPIFDFIRRSLFRFILWYKGYIPRNYVRFLDYAAERIFLRKVGSGYIFIHRTVLEYFASLEAGPSAERGS